MINLTIQFRIITEYVDPNYENVYPDSLTRALAPISFEARFGESYSFDITGDSINGYVHLSTDFETARRVGSRHGKPVIYQVDCQRMVADAHVFFLSANHVWLTKYVPAKYLSKCEGHDDLQQDENSTMIPREGTDECLSKGELPGADDRVHP